jgi:outer membrane protein assembly factor BamB
MSCCPDLRSRLVLLAGLALPALLVGACAGDARKDAPVAGGSGAHSWPMFGGSPPRNMVNLVEKNLPAEWSVKEGEQKNLKWVAETGTRGYLSPVIAGGKVYVATDNAKPRDPKVTGLKAVLLCFRESDGKFLWQLTHDMPPEDVAREALQEGLISSPVVEGERLYYVTPGCDVICASTDGAILWHRDLMKELKVFPCYVANCSPLLVGDLLFLVTGNGRDSNDKLRSPVAPSFVALRKKDGAVVWKDNSPGDKIMESQWGNPCYAEVNGKGQVIFPGGDGWLYSLEPETGKPVWKFDCNPKSADFKPGGRGTRNYFMSTPVFHDNKVYVGVGRNPEDGPGEGRFFCTDVTKTGDVSAKDDNFDPKAEVNKKSALVWSFGGQIKPKPKRGRSFLFARTMSTAAIHDGLCYIPDLDGFLFCLDAKTGEKYWRFDMKQAVWGSPMWIDGKVYLANDDGDVFRFNAGKEVPPAKMEPLGSVERAVKGPVVACNGVLFVQTDSSLYALAGK